MKHRPACGGKTVPDREGRRISVAGLFGALFALLGLVLFFLPGVRFSGCLFMGIAACFAGWSLLNYISAFRREAKMCKAIFLSGIFLAILSLAALEVQVVAESGGDSADIPTAAVLVLGAGVNGERPSLSLQTRINAAAEYLRTHPTVPAVLSGGRGRGERISEAEAMRRGLTELGISEERLWLEDQSVNTAENFARSAEILAEAGIDPKEQRIAVVTSDFHLFRAKLLAQKTGMTEPVGIPAQLPWWWLNANYYIREAFASVKTLLFD